MPEITNHGKFVVDPSYDQDKELAKEIKSTRVYLEKELSAIDQITNPTMQLICMFSLLDSLAQERANYPRDSKKAFCDFLLAHQKQCDYLECVEPITLYYRVEEGIEGAEKEISLDSLGYLDFHLVKETITSGKAQEILDYIAQKKSSQFAEKKRQEHQFISLIYRMRSKAVHEMSRLGETSFYREHLPKEPYYRDVGRGYVLNGDIVSDDICELVIPNAFIRNILQDCVDGYLNECRELKRFPFENNRITRKHRLSWYDNK